MILRMTYYEVGDDYSEDGKGGDYHVVGNFTDKKVADDYAAKAGNYGYQAQVTFREIVIVDTKEEQQLALGLLP